MNNTIIINRHRSNRLELQFIETPQDELSDYLKSLGFVNHVGKPKQFFAPYRDAYIVFAHDLERTLQEKGDLFAIEIRPSSAATKENIELDRFSHLTIEHKDGVTNVIDKYVVFDQYRRIAEAIGTQYGKRKYGSNFVEASALPRKKKTEVRALFKKGRILGKVVTIPTIKGKLLEKPKEDVKASFIKELPTKVYEEIEIPIPDHVKYSTSVKLLEEDGVYYYGFSGYKKFEDHSDFSTPVTNLDKGYSTRKKAIQAGLMEVVETIADQISHTDYSLKNKVKLLDSVVEAIKNIAKEYNIEILGNKVSQNAIPVKVEQPVLSDNVIALPMTTQTFLEEAEREKTKPKSIRKQLVELGFTIPFTGFEAIERNLPVIDVFYRWGKTYNEFDAYVEENYTSRLNTLDKKLTKLNKKKNKSNRPAIDQLEEQQKQLKAKINAIEELIIQEHELFLKELFAAIMDRVEYDINSEEQFLFEESILPRLIEDRRIESYANEPVQRMVAIFTKDYFAAQKSSSSTDPDYVDKVIAMMHGQYMKGKRVTKKQIETLKDELAVPNMGMLWEAVELSWLLWYKNLYNQPVPFVFRLEKMIHFWDTLQPTYAYSDSSKELYKQYSTPCPIGAIIAQYTDMKTAGSIFEPSAGNGLLVLGADPSKTHVNEIDNDRRYSLEVQGFKTITNFNATEPEHFDALEKSFDVVVTNPPFDRWEDMPFDKKRVVDTYFGKHRRLDKFMRLEHLMSGLALHTLKDQGKAALIIMGHLYYGEDGYIAKYRPFFNWLYRHYYVDDIINLNSFKLYNKQGAVAKTMLILIGGRKAIPKGTAPKKQDRPELETIVNDFKELWQRVSSHIKSPIEILYQQLNIAKQYDLL